MKKIFATLIILSAICFQSCEGVPGPQGPQGDPGINILGQVFEVTVDFAYDGNNNLQVSPLISFPSSIEVFESDVVLVYRLETVENGFDVWSPLPQNFFLNGNNIIQYVFNHTFVDVELLIDGNFNLATLGSGFTNDQIFRIAVVPAEFGATNPSMEALLENLSLSEHQIETLD